MATAEISSGGEEYLFSETKRHKPCLIYHGYRYVQDKTLNRTVYWRCEDRTHCNGRAHQSLNDGSYPIITIKHNHPPTTDDLSRHDIIVIDSHRRQRRETQTTNPPANRDKCIPVTNAKQTHSNSSEMMQAKYPLPVPSSSLSQTPSIDPRLYRYPKMDTMETNKMLVNMTKTSKIAPKTPTKTPSFVNDLPSRLNQFSWEEIEGRYVPVIFRNEDASYQRYTSKMYVEHILFQSSSWQPYIVLARSLPPLVSCSYTEAELKLFRSIIEWHLAGVQFKTIPTTDCLIRFEQLLSFYHTLKQLRDNMSNAPGKTLPIKPAPIRKTSVETNLPPTIPRAPPVPIAPVPMKPEAKQSGWIQINNVFLPYIVKASKSHFEYNVRDREFLIPYEILLKCQIFTDPEFPYKQVLVKASQEDFDLLNHLITDINIFDEKVPEKTLLINLYHLMIGLDRIFYVKFLPHKQPRSQVNKSHGEVLKLQGGVLIIQGHPLIPYILQNNRFYVPLYYTCQALPYLLIAARRIARAPRQFEIDYLNLICLYFCIETPSFSSDTLLVDLFNIKSSNLPNGIHFRTLNEHQLYEKKKILQGSSKTTKPMIAPVNQRNTKYPPGQVMINPLIHHPSFYGLTSSTPLSLNPTRPMEQDSVPSLRPVRPSAEIRPMIFHHRTLHVILRSADDPVHQGKISLKEILKQYAFDIDYETFIHWCQSNGLIPLLQLDDVERKVLSRHDPESVYIYQGHLTRCLDLLNDLKRGLISMTLLPQTENGSLTGAKKRKSTMSTVRTETNAADATLVPAPSSSPSVTTAAVPESESITSNTKFANVWSEPPQLSENDDDKMPVVASVEEEQPLDEMEPPLIIVSSTDGTDEKIRFDEAYPSSLTSGTNKSDEIEEAEDESIPTTSSSVQVKKQRARSRSSRSRKSKKLKTTEENQDHEDGIEQGSSSLFMKTINEKQIDQCLRTLFCVTHDKHRIRPDLDEKRKSAKETKDSTSSTDSGVFDILHPGNTNDTISAASDDSISTATTMTTTTAASTSASTDLH